MDKPDTEIFFHRNELNLVCKGLIAGRNYLVLGQPGIGKTTFLRDIEFNWKHMQPRPAKLFRFEHIDFREPSYTADGATFAKTQLLGNLRTWADCSEYVTICLVDSMEKAIAHSDVYNLEFFDELAACVVSPSLGCVVASRGSMYEQLRERHANLRQWEHYRPPVLDTVTLGLLPEAEADKFIVNGGGFRYLKDRATWLEDHVEKIRETVGCYPQYLQQAIGILSRSADAKSFDSEHFREAFLVEVQYSFKETWESLDREEQKFLKRLVEGTVSMEEVQDALKMSPHLKVLVVDGPKLFSLAFQDFVSERTLTHRGLGAVLRPLTWNRGYVTYGMLALLLVYVIVVPLARVLLGSPVWLWTSIGAQVLFVVSFIFLAFLYMRAGSR